jgi:hypothetical protein
MYDLVQMKQNATFEDCVKKARAVFDENFNLAIRNWIHLFPRDAIDKDGNPFW